MIVLLVYKPYLGFFETGNAAHNVAMRDRDLCLERRTIWIVTCGDHCKVGAVRMDFPAIDVLSNRSLTCVWR